MLALADDAALARLVIAATRIPRRARSRWLHNLARTIEDRAADRMRQARARQRAVMQRGSAQAFTAPDGHIEASLRCVLEGQTGKTCARSEPYRF